MKKNILVAGLLLAFASINSFAQTAVAPTTAPVNAPHDRPKHKMEDAATRANKRTERLTKELGLDANASKKVHDIILARGQKMDIAMKNREADKTARKATHEADKAAFMNEMKGILTADQFAKFQEMAERHEKGGRGGHGHRHGDDNK